MSTEQKNFKITTEIYSRVAGYFRPLKQWNRGKQEEFKERKNYNYHNKITQPPQSHLAIIFIFITLLFSCNCQSFDPVQLQDQPDECNDFYSVLKYYSVEGSDSAFVGTVYQECKTARAERRKAERENHCREIYYGGALVDKKDYEKYSQFLECCNK